MEALFKYRKIILLITILIISYFPIFYLLDALTLRIWDESRNATNAIGMLESGNFLVSYCDGAPDMWNTKPPLFIWAQAFFLKIIGYKVLAVRLPSAISAILTVFFIIHFSYYYLGNLLIGVFSSLVLITSNGYIGLHGSRTGDFDVALTLFTFFYSIQYFKFTETVENKKNRHLYLFGVGLAFAGLTKGIAGFILTPALLIYTIIKGKSKSVLSNKHLYLIILSILIIIGGFYFLRDYYNPGYIQKVKDNELGGRFTEAVDGRSVYVLQNTYYFEMFTTQFAPWFYLFVIAVLVIIIFENNKLYLRLTVFLCLVIFFFLAIITYGKSKFPWYDMQVYPLASLVLGISLKCIFEEFNKFMKFNRYFNLAVITLLIMIVLLNPIIAEWLKEMQITQYVIAIISLGVLYSMIIQWPLYEANILRAVTFIVFTLSIFLQPYISVMQKTKWESLYPRLASYELFGDYLKKVVDSGQHKFTVYKEDYNGHLNFYQKKFNREGNNIATGNLHDCKIGDIVVACNHENGIESIKECYYYEILNQSSSDCITCKILSPK